MGRIKFIAVIGANYGDEGKGLMTDYFSHEARLDGKKCLNVLTNGGSQRGHTVDLGSGIRHVFRHFGSGTFAGADTYIPEQYIVNPMNFVKEYKEVVSILGREPIVYVSPYCKVSTPFDMMANQIIENERQDQRHGSCGVGIWETMINGHSPKANFRGNLQLTLSHIKSYYLDERFPKKGIRQLPNEWVNIWSNENLIRHYIDDCNFFTEHTTFANKGIIEAYDTVIFENGQGLMLDKDLYLGTSNEKYTTPSNTGLKLPIEMVESLQRSRADDEFEVCYVSRTYLTRHGNGLFDVDELREKDRIVDATNTFNIWQGALRIGALDCMKMYERTCKDFAANTNFIDAKLTYSFTHCDQVASPNMDDLPNETRTIYKSFGATRNCIIKTQVK